MPMGLIPDSTETRQIGDALIVLKYPTNGQLKRISKEYLRILAESIGGNANVTPETLAQIKWMAKEPGDIDRLMTATAPCVVSIDGDKTDIERKLIRWNNYDNQVELAAVLIAMSKPTEAEEKNSDSSSDGKGPASPTRGESNTEINAETAASASSTVK